jgi:hypothetical protein
MALDVELLPMPENGVEGQIALVGYLAIEEVM